MSVISILPIAVAALTAPSPVAGDFDGDGATDTATIISRADGRYEVLVTFASGRGTLVDRVDRQAELAVISSGLIASLCKPIARDMPDCARQLAGRDRQGLWIKRISGPRMQGLAIWNGTQFRVVASFWPEDAATAAQQAESAASPRTDSPHREESRLRSVLELDLSPSGKVEGCRVVESTAAPELDAKACSIMLEKAKFSPPSGVSAGKRLTTRTEIVWRRQ